MTAVHDYDDMVERIASEYWDFKLDKKTWRLRLATSLTKDEFVEIGKKSVESTAKGKEEGAELSVTERQQVAADFMIGLLAENVVTVPGYADGVQLREVLDRYNPAVFQRVFQDWMTQSQEAMGEPKPSSRP